MSFSDDASPQFARLGASLLDQAIENSSDFSGNPPNNKQIHDQVYLHAVKLSNLLKSLQIRDVNCASLKSDEIRQLNQLIELINDDLELNGKPLSENIGPGSSTYEALRMMSFALLAINQNISSSDMNIQRPMSSGIEDNAIRLENAQLKKKLIDFQEQFDATKQIMDELSKQNTSLTNERVEYRHKVDQLELRIKDFEIRDQSREDLMEALKYEKQAQVEIDQNHINKLQEKSNQDEKTIKNLQKQFFVSPESAQSSYYASLLAAQTDGIEDLLQYLSSEFNLQSLSPKAMLAPLKRAINNRKEGIKTNESIVKTYGDINEYNEPSADSGSVSELRSQIFLLNSQIESDKHQIIDLQDQLSRQRGSSFNHYISGGNAGLTDFEIKKSENENRANELRYQNLLIENTTLTSQNYDLKKEIEIINAELQASKELLKGSPDKALRTDEKRDLNEENTRIYVLESEIKAKNIKLNDMNDLCKKRKEKIHSLNQTVQNLQDEVKSKQNKIEILKMQNDRLSVEHDDLMIHSAKDEATKDEAQLSEMRLMENENNKLNSAISELSIEMSAITGELEKELEIKNHIFLLFQKQSQLLSASEAQIKSYQTQIVQKDDEIRLTKQNIEKVKHQLIAKKAKCEHREVINSIQQFLASNNSIPTDCQTSINNIINNNNADNDVIPTLIQLLTFFLEKDTFYRKNQEQCVDSQKIKLMQEQNDRLFIYISNILRFIDQLANSGELQQCIIDSNYDIDYRPQLLAQYGRIEAFIRLNCQETELLQICDNITDFPIFLNNFTNGKLTDNREQILVMQLCFMANDLLHKFADKILNQNETLRTDISQIRRELVQTNDDQSDKINDAIKNMATELEDERSRRINSEDTLNKITKKLKISNSNDPVVHQCLSLLDGSDEVWTDDVHAVQKLQKELQKVTLEREQAYKANQILAKKAKDTIKKLKVIVKDQSVQLEETNKAKEQLALLLKEKESLQSSLNQQKLESVKKGSALKDLQHKIKENEAMKDASISKYKEESELQISSLQEELEDWKKKSECNDMSTHEEVRRLKRDFKLKNRRMQNDLVAQIQRADDIRKHFEPILADLREKVNNLRESEAQLQNEKQNFDIEKKQLKSELSNARIDLKMIQMKLSAAEEKVARDRNLVESQYKMKLVGQESKHQTELEDQKSEFESTFHSFLVSICEKFKDFVDFNEMITKSSVQIILDKVSTKLEELGKKVKELQSANSEIIKLQSLLGLQPHDSLLPAISAISQDASEYNQKREEIEKSQVELKNLVSATKTEISKEKSNEEWEQWARRIHALISDNFGTALTAKNLQFALEEALLGNIGQRLTTRRLEILRTEKQILLSGILLNDTNNNNKQQISSYISTKGSKQKQPQTHVSVLSIKHILVAFACVHKMQKISGHLKCNISSPKRKTAPETPKIKEKTMLNHKGKHFPILNVHE